MKKCGFTLLELLVVIAVIGMLTAVLIPVLRAAKNQARSIQCGCNIRQLSLGFAAYQQDYGAFPYGLWFEDLINPPFRPEGSHSGYGTYDYQGLWWFNYLQYFSGRVVTGQETQQDPILLCPARKFTGPASTENVLCGNYGVNRSICRDSPKTVGCQFFGDPISFNEIRSPSGTFLITDSGYSVISWFAAVDGKSPVFENYNRIDAFYIPGLKSNQNRSELADQPDAIKGRHPHQTLNIGFADGHTEVRDAESLAIDPAAAASGNIPSIWMP